MKLEINTKGQIKNTSIKINGKKTDNITAFYFKANANSSVIKCMYIVYDFNTDCFLTYELKNDKFYIKEN